MSELDSALRRTGRSTRSRRDDNDLAEQFLPSSRCRDGPQELPTLIFEDNCLHIDELINTTIVDMGVIFQLSGQYEQQLDQYDPQLASLTASVTDQTTVNVQVPIDTAEMALSTATNCHLLEKNETSVEPVLSADASERISSITTNVSRSAINARASRVHEMRSSALTTNSITASGPTLPSVVNDLALPNRPQILATPATSSFQSNVFDNTFFAQLESQLHTDPASSHSSSTDASPWLASQPLDFAFNITSLESLATASDPSVPLQGSTSTPGGSAAPTMALIFVGIRKPDGTVRNFVEQLELPSPVTLDIIIDLLLGGQNQTARFVRKMQQDGTYVATSNTPIPIDMPGYDQYHHGFVKCGTLGDILSPNDHNGQIMFLPAGDTSERAHILQNHIATMRLYVIYIYSVDVPVRCALSVQIYLFIKKQDDVVPLSTLTSHHIASAILVPSPNAPVTSLSPAFGVITIMNHLGSAFTDIKLRYQSLDSRMYGTAYRNIFKLRYIFQIWTSLGIGW
ncbi:hypothetical protein EW146_g8293 [Bondarzewia mesenterica]|uniref:Uncharacterized protein n=1 Tax=Bondarzewia mesenterica TaxID=1095465 RepID=A0A4V3XDR0_9AGAM|nr:hypothetical protein EW146_g8293 [Bondarzewia mesenterica]